MPQELLVAGGGIAGLAAAIGARAAGWEVRVCEQARAFGEDGAGLQLGPNATRLLRDWRLLASPLLRAYEPARLQVRDAQDGRELGSLRLRQRAVSRYGAPYLTVHRADLHATLLRGAQLAGARLHAGTRIASAQVTAGELSARTGSGALLQAEALAVADGVWSQLRAQLLADADAPATGHLAYRALLPAAQLPASLRSDDVQAWLGPQMHLVRYPVRGGEAVNIVGFVEGRAQAGWDHAAPPEALRHAAGGVCGELQALLEAVDGWRSWPVHDRPPVRGPHELARGVVALVGDAAHPMRPYLAQGAGMALEDAAALQQVLSTCDGGVLDVATSLRRYAQDRWQRCARVQARSRRNGWIFHASGPLRLARNLAMRAGGEPMLDLPWLYGGR